MKAAFPSREFDEAVAAACHGTATDEQLLSISEVLRSNPAARDEYILRVELHARLASDPDLFVGGVRELEAPAGANTGPGQPQKVIPLPSPPGPRRRGLSLRIALAAGLTLLAAGWWGWSAWRPSGSKGATSRAVAMLNRVVEAEWDSQNEPPRPGAPLEPGRLKLNSGLAQVVFYSGARVVIEGPAEFELVSANAAFCKEGRLVAEVPPPAQGFRISTPGMEVTDLGTAFGMEVKQRQTELHVFKGSVEFRAGPGGGVQKLKEGAGAETDGAGSARAMVAQTAKFASLFALQEKSMAAEVLRHEQWGAASSRLDEDPTLLVHFDFESMDLSDWRLANASGRKTVMPDAAIVGCQWTEGRWRDKRALEFRGMSDRVRLEVAGDYNALTLAAWVRVQGLDRQINSLFMSDGFEAGTVHWSVRQDGVLALTAIGSDPSDYQICTSPPALTLNQFGLWVHLAVVIDGGGKHVVHYLNGAAVSEHALNIKPPFRVGVAELGNWNAKGFPKSDPFMIRNFGGAMDEFCLFSRGLRAEEVRALHAAGKPQPEPVASGEGRGGGKDVRTKKL